MRLVVVRNDIASVLAGKFTTLHGALKVAFEVPIISVGEQFGVIVQYKVALETSPVGDIGVFLVDVVVQMSPVISERVSHEKDDF